jgi:hypothetical protein
MYWSAALEEVSVTLSVAVVPPPPIDGAGAVDAHAVPFEVSTFPLVPGLATPVPPLATPNGLVRATSCELFTVIAVVSPVWISSELSLSPVEISPPGDVVVLLIIDAI